MVVSNWFGIKNDVKYKRKRSTNAINASSVWFGSKTTQVGGGIWPAAVMPIFVHKKNEKLLISNQNFFFIHKSLSNVFIFFLPWESTPFSHFSYLLNFNHFRFVYCFGGCLI